MMMCRLFIDIYDINAVTNSVTPNDHHTPLTSYILERINATGIIITAYLNTDITSDGSPFPNPSSAPEAVTDTDDTIKPALIILSAWHRH
mgnify:FL=1